MAFPAPSVPSHPKPLPAFRDHGRPFSRHPEPERIEDGEILEFERSDHPDRLAAERRAHLKIVGICTVIVSALVLGTSIYEDRPSGFDIPFIIILFFASLVGMAWVVYGVLELLKAIQWGAIFKIVSVGGVILILSHFMTWKMFVVLSLIYLIFRR